MATLKAAIYWDDDLRALANAAGANYWHVYTREICEQMGLCPVQLPRRDLNSEGLGELKVLILPDLSGKYLSVGEKSALRQWVHAGGLLIGLATEGLGDLFGIAVDGEIPQSDDCYSLSAALRFTDPNLARPLLPPGEEDAPIPIAAPARLLRASADCRELARLVSLAGRDLRRPAVTLRSVGKGQALYFAFHLAQSIWVMHHGRPILDDYDGDGKLRSSDAMILRPFPTSLPYADLLVMLLRNAIGHCGLPFIHALPPLPETGEVPDALFHWGGDDEALAGQQLPASEFMRELGLPYHINIMARPGEGFSLTKAEYEQLKANGHEPSLHFNFIDGVEHPYSFTRQDIQKQVDEYVASFGELPVCTVFHWTVWNLWSEPAEWMASCGLLGDNSHVHQPCPPSNPINIVGFGFGTSYPYHYYHDWRKENDRIRFLELPITAYECGYWQHTEELDLKPLHRAIDLARYWHLTMNMFYHPVLIYQFPQCREAIKAGLNYMRRLGLRPLHMGNDRLTRWWLARSESSILDAALDADGRRMTVHSEWPEGMVVQALVDSPRAQATVDGQPRPMVVREEHGACWLYVSVPQGTHEVRISPGQTMAAGK